MENQVILNYKASNIAKAEEIHKKNFMSCLGNLGNSMSFSDLRFLVIAGGGTDDDFDKLFASGIDNFIITIIEGVSKAGFLGKETIDVESLKAQIHESMKNVSETVKTSPISGNETNL